MTPNCIGFSKDSRLIGEEARSLSMKDPLSALCFSHRVQGIPPSLVPEVESRYIKEHNYVPIAWNNTLFFKFPNETVSAEAIDAIMLEQVLAKKPDDLVITVPAFYNQRQRKSLQKVCEAARFKLTGLIHENTAAGLYFGIDRFDNESAVHVLLFNLGSSYLQTSLIKYEAVLKKTSKLKSKWLESVDVIAHSYNRLIGGTTFDAGLADHLKTEAISQLNLNSEDSLDKKAMRKLMQAANTAKKTLSASPEARIFVPALSAGKDFEYTLKREVLENIIESYKEDLLRPVKEVLAKAGLEKADLVEIVGGVSRIPKIQRILEENVGYPETNLNGDEAMAHGAAIFGSNSTVGVQLKPLWLTDRLPYGIKVQFRNDEGYFKEKDMFPEGTVYPDFKRIGFKYGNNIDIVALANYTGEFEEIERFSVKDIEDVSKRYKETPQLLFEFLLDSSGVFKIDRAEAIVYREIEKKSYYTDEDKKPHEVINKKDKKHKEKLPIVDAMHTSDEPIQKIREKIDYYTNREIQINALKAALNDLESFLYDMIDESSGPEFQKVMVPEEYTEFTDRLKSTFDKLQTYTDINQIQGIKESIQAKANPVFEKREELFSRENAILDAYTTLSKLYDDMIYLNKTKTWVPLEDKEKVFLLINETKSWVDNKVEQQNKLKDWEEPALKTQSIEHKIKGAEKRVDIIRNTPRPKEKPKVDL